MDWHATEIEDLVVRAARGFAARTLAPAAAQRDRDELFPAQEMAALADLGLVGMTVRPDDEGRCVGAAAQARVIAEIAAADASVAVTLAVTNMVAEMVSRFAHTSVRTSMIDRLVSGDAVAGSFALSEPQAGSDAAALRTTARRVRGGYVLNGSKQWITSGDRAGVLLVLARQPDLAASGRASAGLTAFVLERGAPGLGVGRHERKMGQRGSTTVALALEEVFVPEEHRLGAEGEGFALAMAALDSGRINIAALATGIARAALRCACDHARMREAFGGTLASLPAIQTLLADAVTSIEAGWCLVLAAADAKDRGRPFTRLAAEAKLFATERAQTVCNDALQVLGGYGYTRDHPVERHVRDVRVTTIYEGTSQVQRIVIAKHILRGADRG